MADEGSKTLFPASVDLHTKLHARGIQREHEIALFNAGIWRVQYRGDHFLICPPFIVTRTDVDEIVGQTVRVSGGYVCWACRVAEVGKDFLSGGRSRACVGCGNRVLEASGR